MGHCINYIVADKNVNRESVLSDICEEVAHEDWEEGGNYPGNLHLSSHWHEDKVYDSEEDAYEAIKRFDNGWYDDHAVLFRDTSNLENAKTKKLSEQIAAAKQKKDEYIGANHVTSRKSVFVGCPHCGSTLSREHLRSDKCPLCRTDLRSETVRNRIKGYDDKVKELRKKLAVEKKKLADKAPVKWLVKYEYHG